MHSKSDNIEVMTYDDTNEVIRKMFESFLSRYKIDLETQMRVIDFIFDFVNLMHYKFHKRTFKRGG